MSMSCFAASLASLRGTSGFGPTSLAAAQTSPSWSRRQPWSAPRRVRAPLLLCMDAHANGAHRRVIFDSGVSAPRDGFSDGYALPLVVRYRL